MKKIVRIDETSLSVQNLKQGSKRRRREHVGRLTFAVEGNILAVRVRI